MYVVWHDDVLVNYDVVPDFCSIDYFVLYDLSIFIQRHDTVCDCTEQIFVAGGADGDKI